MKQDLAAPDNASFRLGTTKTEDSSIARMKYIETELSLGLTFITVAFVAYHMGQNERGDVARAKAEEARSEAGRLLASVMDGDSESISAKAKELDGLLREVAGARTIFNPYLCQPSMS
jgi:hypothetical protein